VSGLNPATPRRRRGWLGSTMPNPREIPHSDNIELDTAARTGPCATPEKIANRTVTDEHVAVTDKVKALYGQHTALPADTAGPKMTRG